GGGGGGGGGGGRRGGFGPLAAPGSYKVVLTLDGQESSQALKVEADPDYPLPPEIAGASEESEGYDDAEMEADEYERESSVIDD
ncbi:MAG: hypothetical protein K2X91_06090, partial [Thermoleophilia bacterium]|nr:hypothetical protein [Thermoleophilia bacterium]